MQPQEQVDLGACPSLSESGVAQMSSLPTHTAVRPPSLRRLAFASRCW